MASTLPAGTGQGPHLQHVLTSALRAVQGEPNRLGLAPARHVAVVLVDGLGAESLALRAGHARFLTAALARGARITTGAPTTTAAALTSLTTGADAGTHGVVGYTALDPATGVAVNQLHGFDDGTLPDDWQRSTTVFERAAAAGIGAYSIGPAHYATTGFTRAVFRGAEYRQARSFEARFRALGDAFAGAERAIAYLYVPELDAAAHAEGWQSARWTGELELLDAAAAAAAETVGPETVLLLTADHGILDVPEAHRYAFDAVPGLLDGVRTVAGEPRLLHLHLEQADTAAKIAARWRLRLGKRAWVATRAEAIAAGWFGSTAAEVEPRIGEVLVAARGSWAFVDSRSGPHGMIGHHGSWSDAERVVPLIRLDAASRGGQSSSRP